MNLEEKKRLVADYFSLQRAVFLLQRFSSPIEEQESSEASTSNADDLNQQLIRQEKAIQRHVKAEEISGLVNYAFDYLYPDDREVDKKEGLFFQEKAKKLIRMKIEQQDQSATLKAFGYTLLCCLLIVPIPFFSRIREAFRVSFLKKMPLIVRAIEDEKRHTYASMGILINAEENNRAQVSDEEQPTTLKKNDLFNKSGELRKFFMFPASHEKPEKSISSLLWGTSAQFTRMNGRLIIRLLGEACDILRDELVDLQHDAEKQLKIYQAYRYVCNQLKKELLSQESFFQMLFENKVLNNEDQVATLAIDINTVKANLTSHYKQLKQQSTENIQKIIRPSRG